MKRDLYIYGAGGLGREVLSLVKSLDAWNPAGFIDDNIIPGTVVKGVPVLGGKDIVRTLPHLSQMVIALGDPKLKASIYREISGLVICPVLVHPNVILQDSSSIHIGEGSIISAGCVLTTDIKIGNQVLVNLRCTIGHDTEIGDCTSIMPAVNIAGGVTIGESVLLGSGSNIINNVNIGSRSRVGMGAVVLHHVLPDTTVAGVPAKIINQ